MAGLLSWIGNAAKKVENTVNNDVVQPIQRDIVQPVVHQAQGVVAQVNPLDNGRTYQTVMQHGAQYAPKLPSSAIQQAFHTGMANFIGNNFIKPIAQFPIDASNQLYNHFVVPVLHTPTLTPQQVTPISYLAKNVGATGSLHQTLGSGAQTALTIGTGGLAKGIEAGASRILPKAAPTIIRNLAPKVASNATIGAGFGASSAAAQGAKPKDILKAAGVGAGLGATVPVAGAVAKVAIPRVVTGAKAVNSAVNNYADKRGLALGASTKPIKQDPLAALKQEALKYKSADEFVNGQAKGKTPIFTEAQRGLLGSYTGTGKDFEKGTGTINVGKHGDNTTLIHEVAHQRYEALPQEHQGALDYALKEFNDKNPGAFSTTNDPAENIALAAQDYLQNKRQFGSKFTNELNKTTNGRLLQEFFKQNTDTAANGTTKIPYSKQQLTDLYNQAHAEANNLNSKVAKQPTSPGATKENPQLPKLGLKNVPVGDVGKTGLIAKSNIPQGEQGKITAKNQELPSTSVANDTTKQRGFTTSIKHSQNFSSTLRKQISSQYSIASDKQTIENTQSFLKQPFNNATSDVLNRLQSTKRPDKQLINDAGTVMQILDAKGKTTEAQNIHDLLSEHLTNAGQTSQAASLLLRRSPDGIYHKAVSDLKKAGIDVAPIDKQLQALRENIRKTMPDTVERDTAVQKMKQFVAKNIPSSARDKMFAIWRAGLLTGPRTVAKIITSHGIQLPLEELKNIPASAVDRVVSLATGQRSLVNTTQGLRAGFKEGVHAGFSKQGYLRSGIDVQPGSNAVEFHNSVNFGNSTAGKIADAYANGVGRLHGSLYKPFYGSVFKNSLYSQALAAAKTAKLKGTEADKFIGNFVKNPSKDALNVAQREAEQATFQQKTSLGEGASMIQRIPGVGRYIAPFTRIPSAIASDMVDYSPVGAIKTIAKGIQAAKQNEGWSIADQRAFAQGLGRSITGTAALVPGYMLYNRGMMTLQYPTNPDEQKIWALEGKKENSVLVGGKWRSLGSLGPIGAVLSLGGGLAAGVNSKKGIVGSAMTGAGQGLKSIADQPYVQGLTMAASAINDPGRYLSSLQKQYAGSVVPVGIAQVASALDPLARKANTPVDTIKSKIPGLRETLMPSKNAFGGNIPNGESGLPSVLDPFYSSKNIPPDSTLKELQRLLDVGNGTMPATQAQKNSFNGVKVQLTKPQAQQLSAEIGQAVKPLWDTTISSPGYKALNDDLKHKALASILSDTSSAVKNTYAQQNGLGKFSSNFTGKPTNLSLKQSAIASGNFDPGAYTTKSASTSMTSPMQKYKTALANYNDTQKNMTEVQRYEAQQNLNKLQVQSNFSNDVIGLYGLSKSKISNFLANSSNGQTLANQLKQYDQALYNAGLSTSLKFKNGFSSSAARTSSGKVSRGRAVKAKKISYKAAYAKPPKVKAIKTPRIKAPKVASFKAPKLSSNKLPKTASARPTKTRTPSLHRLMQTA